MKKIKYYNRLVIDSDNDRIFLAHENDITDVLYGNDLDDLVIINEDGYADRHLPDELDEEDFDKVYYEDADGKYEFIDDDDAWNEETEPKHYSKADWKDYEHYIQLSSEHGIRNSSYDITNAEVIPCDVFKADDYVPQDYPRQEHENFFKVVSEEDGKIYYVKMTSPFYTDDQDYVYEFTDEETFSYYE